MKERMLRIYTVDRTPPKNLAPGDQLLFEHELRKSFGPIYLTTLHNAYVLKDLVFKPFHFYVSQSLSYRMARRDQLKRLTNLLHPGPVLDKCIWILDDWAVGYFHWLTDALPRLMLCRGKLLGHQVLLPESYREMPYITQSLDMLGYSYVFYSGNCRVRELLLPDRVSVPGNYFLPVLYDVRQALLKDQPPVKPFRKIYVSRKYAQIRKLTNEDEFAGLLEQYGFETHYFEHYSLAEQMKLMQETRYFIGLHGSGLTNIFFMQPETRVMELRFTDDKQNNCYFSLASACGVDYYYQVGGSGDMDPHTANMYVDLEKVRENLDLFLRD